jgi:hypothetical protein
MARKKPITHHNMKSSRSNAFPPLTRLTVTSWGAKAAAEATDRAETTAALIFMVLSITSVW